MDFENDILIMEKPVDSQLEISNQNQINQTVNNEYKQFTDFSHAKRKNDYEEFEVVQTYVPRKKNKKNTDFDNLVNEQNSYISANETYTYEKTKPQKKFKPTSKIFVCISCVIALFMGTLGIVNAVNINNVSNSITSTTEQIANIGKEITKIDQVIEGMVNEENIKNEAEQDGFTEVTTKTEIDLNEKNVVEDYKKTTNLFDIICNFIMSLFGG